jgi:hypothetical protein
MVVINRFVIIMVAHVQASQRKFRRFLSTRNNAPVLRPAAEHVQRAAATWAVCS